MDHYSSCLDSSFLPRGLAMYWSLVRHAPPFRWWVMCLDDDAYRGLTALGLPGVVPIKEDDVLDAELARAKARRSRREYYFSCKPWVYLSVLMAAPSAERVTHLDGDLYFFSDVSTVNDDVRGSSIALSPHRSGRPRWESLFGIYNSGWSSFANDDIGRDALTWWRERCVEAVPDYPMRGRFADQKYLEELPDRFGRVFVMRHKGVNLAPWNARSSTPIEEGDDLVTAGGDPLVFFHFHRLSKVGPHLYDPGWRPSGATRLLRSRVYRPYIHALQAAENIVERALRRPPRRVAAWGATRPRPWWWRMGRATVKRATGLATLRFIVARRSSLA